MGRTIPTYHEALDQLLARWERDFGRVMWRAEDRAAFREVVLAARRHVTEGTNMASGDLLERVFLSVLVDAFRQLKEVEAGPGKEVSGPLDAFNRQEEAHVD